jgi:hypothetical protein
MRQSLGTAVFAGMLGVTAFGLLFTPAFYTVVRKIGRAKPKKTEGGISSGDIATTKSPQATKPVAAV